MPSSTYEVVTTSVTVPTDTTGVPGTYTVTAPTGKKALGGGFRDVVPTDASVVRVTASYPSGQDWKFDIVGAASQHTVHLYVTAAEV